jgi:hypothetical protein
MSNTTDHDVKAMMGILDDIPTKSLEDVRNEMFRNFQESSQAKNDLMKKMIEENRAKDEEKATY